MPSIAPAFPPVHPCPQCSSQAGAAAPSRTSIDQKFLRCAWKKKNLLESCPGTWFSRADSFTGRKAGCLKPGDILQASERKSGWSQSQFDPSVTSAQSRKRGAGAMGSTGRAAPSTQAPARGTCLGTVGRGRERAGTQVSTESITLTSELCC